MATFTYIAFMATTTTDNINSAAEKKQWKKPEREKKEPEEQKRVKNKWHPCSVLFFKLKRYPIALKDSRRGT